VSSLKERYLDGIAAPTSEVLRLGDADFIDIANNVFAFDGAVVLSSEFSVTERRVDFRLNYIAKMDPEGLRWRKLRLHLGGIDTIDFSHRDAELGFPHMLVRHVELEYAVRNQPSLFSKLESSLWKDHTGVELVAISFEAYPSPLDQVLDKSNPATVGKVRFDWEPVGDQSRILVDTIECREIEIEFLTPAANQPWPE